MTIDFKHFQIEIYDLKFEELIESKKIGLGQLFRYFRLLPSFYLLSAGRKDDKLWREYELICPQMKCHFQETFETDFLNF